MAASFSTFDDLLATVAERASAGHDFAVEAGTGMGKSRRVPKAVLDNVGRDKVVFVVQPRRVIAERLAADTAQQQRWTLGQEVGYRTGRKTECEDDSKLQFVTTKVAIKLFQRPDMLQRAGAVIVDEVHERSIAADVLMLQLKMAKQANPELVLGLLTASMPPSLVHYFGMGLLRMESWYDTPYRVDVQFSQAKVSRRNLASEVVRTVRDLEWWEHALVFLPGQQEINDVHGRLKQDSDLYVCRLYSGLPAEEQRKAFERCPAHQRKVVLATNIAESSLTFEDLYVVVDSGLRRTSTLDANVLSYHVLPITDTSFQQRKGRIGRVQRGRMICLYTEAERMSFQCPQTVFDDELNWAYLELRQLGFATADLVDPPPHELLLRAHQQCRRLGLLDAVGVTPAGHSVLGLPLPLQHAACFLKALEAGTDAAAAVLAVLVLADGTWAPSTEHFEAAEQARVDEARLRASGQGDFALAQWVMRQAVECAAADDSSQRLKAALAPLALNVKVVAEAHRCYSKVWQRMGKATPSPTTSELANTILADAFDVADYRGTVIGRFPEMQYLSRKTGRVLSLGKNALRVEPQQAPATVLFLRLQETKHSWAGVEIGFCQSLPRGDVDIEYTPWRSCRDAQTGSDAVPQLQAQARTMEPEPPLPPALLRPMEPAPPPPPALPHSVPEVAVLVPPPAQFMAEVAVSVPPLAEQPAEREGAPDDVAFVQPLARGAAAPDPAALVPPQIGAGAEYDVLVPPGYLGLQFSKDQAGRRVVRAIMQTGCVPTWNAHCDVAGLAHKVTVGDIWIKLNHFDVGELTKGELETMLREGPHRLRFLRTSELVEA